MQGRERDNPFRKSVLLVSFGPSADATVETALSSIGLAVTHLAVDEFDEWGLSLARDSIIAHAPTVVVLETEGAPSFALQLCAEISASSCSAPPVLLVGRSAGPACESAAMEVGAAAYLVRPLRPGTFLSTLSDLGLWGARAHFRQPLRAPIIWTDREGKSRAGESVDLSLSGIKFLADDCPEIGSNIRVELLVPGRSDFIAFWVRVLRARVDASGEQVAAGRILQISERDRARLGDAIRTAHRDAFDVAHPHRTTILDEYTVRRVMEWTTFLINRARFDGPPNPVQTLEERVKSWILNLPEEEVALFDRGRQTEVPSGASLVWLQALVAYRFHIEEIRQPELTPDQADAHAGDFTDRARQALELLDRSLTAWASFVGASPGPRPDTEISTRVLKRTLRSTLALRDVYERARTDDLPAFFGALREAKDYFRDLDAPESVPPRAHGESRTPSEDPEHADPTPFELPGTQPRHSWQRLGLMALGAILFAWLAATSLRETQERVVALDTMELSDLSPFLAEGRRSFGPNPVFFGELDAERWLSVPAADRRREAERLSDALRTRGIHAGVVQRGGILAVHLVPEGVDFVE